ncbi:MAG: hypothetical protein NZM38_10315 [Cytophagales bacterium]|nr:hypothetical protein [Cytophagales bacterium]MDW8385147.1 hypothetical protein [Flammeovirgaceae bacterium]
MKRLFFFVWSVLLSISTYAQCAMCKANVESNLKTGIATIGKGINAGILYLMAFPYLAFVVIAYFWYRNSKQEAKRKASIAALKAKLSKSE